MLSLVSFTNTVNYFFSLWLTLCSDRGTQKDVCECPLGPTLDLTNYNFKLQTLYKIYNSSGRVNGIGEVEDTSLRLVLFGCII